jgi:hypothetical protein
MVLKPNGTIKISYKNMFTVQNTAFIKYLPCTISPKRICRINVGTGGRGEREIKVNYHHPPPPPHPPPQNLAR